jgi:hypothetical protein
LAKGYFLASVDFKEKKINEENIELIFNIKEFEISIIISSPNSPPKYPPIALPINPPRPTNSKCFISSINS